MALPLMLGICLVTGVACFLTDRATKAANKVTHDGDNVNSRPPAPATSSNNLNRRPPATSSNNLNRRPPATSSDNLNRRPLAPATSSHNLNYWPPAPATSSSDKLNRRSSAAPATSPDNLNRVPLAPAASPDNLNRVPLAPATSPDNLNRLPPALATLSDNLNPRLLMAPASSSNNPVMHVGNMAAELAKYEVCPLVHSTDAVGPVVVHLQTDIVEEVKIHELSNGLAEGLENNDVFKVCLGDGLGAVTSVVDLELDDNIDAITPLIEEADLLKLEEEVVNLSGGVIGSGEGWWVAVKKWVEERFRWVKGKVKRWAEWVEERFRWVKGKVKRWAEWVIHEADVLKLEEEAANLSGSGIGSEEGWWVAMKKWMEERFRWGKGKGMMKRWAERLMLNPDVDMHRMLRRLVWVVVDSMVESKYGIGHYRVPLKMYRILINELRCR